MAHLIEWLQQNQLPCQFKVTPCLVVGMVCVYQREGTCQASGAEHEINEFLKRNRE